MSAVSDCDHDWTKTMPHFEKRNDWGWHVSYCGRCGIVTGANFPLEFLTDDERAQAERAGEDFRRHRMDREQRRKAWDDYMLSHDPPAVGVSSGIEKQQP